MSHIIFHIDVNSAYLSWTAVEQLKNGADVDIRTIPAIIGGDRESRHGIVLAKSPSAKKFGIRTGEPVVNAFRKCPNLHMDPPNHRMYREYSRRLMDFLKTYTPEIEQVSVDECYMDFTGIAQRFSSPVEAAYEIKARVYEKFGVEGESYKKIAESLCISPETVKWHIKNMLQKTNFDSKTKLAVAVTKKNLIINGF